FLREALCWGRTKHPNILPFIGVDDRTAPSFWLISPWMENGSLTDFLPKHPNFDRTDIAIDIAQGMRYLHELDPPILHPDIRGANVLVTNDRRCCLADFGLSAGLEMTISSMRGAGTLPWLAPEAILPSEGAEHSLKIDIFAFGCTLFEIFTGNHPFKVERLTFINVLDGQRASRPAAAASSQEITDSSWALIESCWKHDPAERPSAREILWALSVPLSPNYTVLYRPGMSNIAALRLFATHLSIDATDPELSIDRLRDKLQCASH
ncbi:kinase-like domain-containing protein, partial [Mycena rebaudengoi]